MLFIRSMTHTHIGISGFWLHVFAHATLQRAKTALDIVTPFDLHRSRIALEAPRPTVITGVVIRRGPKDRGNVWLPCSNYDIGYQEGGALLTMYLS